MNHVRYWLLLLGTATGKKMQEYINQCGKLTEIQHLFHCSASN